MNHCGSGAKEETLDEFFERTQWHAAQSDHGGVRGHVGTVYEEQLKWVPEYGIVYARFQVMQHANQAVDEVRRARFFRRGGPVRGLVKGKRWLLLQPLGHPDACKRQLLNDLFRLNRRMMKAYLLKESLDRLWTYTCEGAAKRYLNRWIDQ